VKSEILQSSAVGGLLQNDIIKTSCCHSESRLFGTKNLKAVQVTVTKGFNDLKERK